MRIVISIWNTRLSRGLGSMLAAALFSFNAHGAPTQFTIDPAQSKITASGSVISPALLLQEQGPGSLTSTFSGTILADVSATGIQFPGDSALKGVTNGVWEPGPNGVAGVSAPADFAAQATGGVFGTIKGALRNLLLDVTSDVLPLVNGQFDASALTFAFPTNSTASFDYDAGFVGHGGFLLASKAKNKIVNGGTWSNAGGAQTLSIQVDTEFKFKALSDNDSAVRLVGSLFAKESPVLPPLRISSIQVKGQVVTIEVAGATAGAQVQVSTDLKGWNPQTATRTEAQGTTGTIFTFPVSGTQEFFLITQ